MEEVFKSLRRVGSCLFFPFFSSWHKVSSLAYLMDLPNVLPCHIPKEARPIHNGLTCAKRLRAVLTALGISEEGKMRGRTPPPELPSEIRGLGCKIHAQQAPRPELWM